MGEKHTWAFMIHNVQGWPTPRVARGILFASLKMWDLFYTTADDLPPRNEPNTMVEWLHSFEIAYDYASCDYFAIKQLWHWGKWNMSLFVCVQLFSVR